VAWRPEREIELVVGTPAGGGQDRPARALIAALESLRLPGVPFKLVNLPGRGGGNAWDHLARHPGDPHRLSISSPPLVTNRLLGAAGIDHRDLTPLPMLYTEYIAFVVRQDSPLRAAPELLQRLRDPASLTVALATARGNTNHIALGLCTRHAGGDVRALQLQVFDSALHAVAAVLEGRADVAAVTAVSAAPEIASGRLRALAVSAPQRLQRELASAPTWRELGVDCVVGTWRGVTGAPGLTPDQVAYWEAAFAAAAQTPAWNRELARHYWANTYLGSAATRAFLDTEARTLERALSGLGLIGQAR
jgi:putative tricarboxylic transport membrane protein